MARSEAAFQNRVRKVEKNYRARIERGSVAMMRKDGLIVIRPRRRTPSFPWKGLALMIAGFFMFKTFILITSGTGAYEERRAMLAQGTQLEVAGAWVMQVDPVTRWLQEQYIELERGLL